MKKLQVVIKNELLRYFVSPLAYVYLIAFLLLNGSFAVYFGHFTDRGIAGLESMFVFQPWLYLLFIPGISMRLWAEEFRSKTVVQLLTMPVSVATLVWGKFFASWIFVAVALILTFPFWITVNLLGTPDNGVILLSYFGSWILAGCMIAISQTMSALTKNQVIALVLAVIVNFLFFLSGIEYVLGFFRLFAPAAVVDMVASFSFIFHFGSVIGGLLELRDIVFFVSIIALFNITTALAVSFRTSGTSRWLKSTEGGYYVLFFMLLIIAFIGLNLTANRFLRTYRLDVTEERLHSLTPSSVKVLQNLPEPVIAKLYYSPELGRRNPEIRLMYDRVRQLLDEFSRLEPDNFSYKTYHPKTLDDIEDQAIAAGLQPLPLVDLSQNGFFGLVLTDKTYAGAQAFQVLAAWGRYRQAQETALELLSWLEACPRRDEYPICMRTALSLCREGAEWLEDFDGAEEYGFATSALIVLGCVMMRKCHLNTCPVGVATQNEELRKRFHGRADYLVHFFNFLAEEVREALAEMGFTKLDDIIGRTDLIEVKGTQTTQRTQTDAADLYNIMYRNKKYALLDFSRLTYQPKEAATNALRYACSAPHPVGEVLDRRILQQAEAAIESGRELFLDYAIANTDRSVGAMLSGAIARRHGAEGLPKHTLNIRFKGSAGQSFGAFLVSGVNFRLEGEANDYVGKGLSGGRISVMPPVRSTFVAENNTIVGNTLLYGATSGELYINGRAGERFAVRNSGAIAVVEGVGDHCCEYMTGGRVVVLGRTGRNFAAGMSGGVAYVWNPEGDFDYYCNMEMVELSLLEESAARKELLELIRKHYHYTGSQLAGRMLDNWERYADSFIQVTPIEYKKVLQEEQMRKLQQKIEEMQRDY